MDNTELHVSENACFAAKQCNDVYQANQLCKITEKQWFTCEILLTAAFCGD